jgi:hypothetical protein
MLVPLNKRAFHSYFGPTTVAAPGKITQSPRSGEWCILAASLVALGAHMINHAFSRHLSNELFYQQCFNRRWSPNRWPKNLSWYLTIALCAHSVFLLFQSANLSRLEKRLQELNLIYPAGYVNADLRSRNAEFNRQHTESLYELDCLKAIYDWMYHSRRGGYDMFLIVEDGKISDGAQGEIACSPYSETYLREQDR